MGTPLYTHVDMAVEAPQFVIMKVAHTIILSTHWLSNINGIDIYVPWLFYEPALFCQSVSPFAPKNRASFFASSCWADTPCRIWCSSESNPTDDYMENETKYLVRKQSALPGIMLVCPLWNRPLKRHGPSVLPYSSFQLEVWPAPDEVVFTTQNSETAHQA